MFIVPRRSNKKGEAFSDKAFFLRASVSCSAAGKMFSRLKTHQLQVKSICAHGILFFQISFNDIQYGMCTEFRLPFRVDTLNEPMH